MVGDKQQKTKNNSVELEATLAPGDAEVGAVAKALQPVHSTTINTLSNLYPRIRDQLALGNLP